MRKIVRGFFKEGELKLLAPFYVYMFIAVAAMAIFPFMVIYFRDLGFSFFEFFTLLGAWTSSTVFFEVPTGAVADSLSRKYSVIFGLILAGISALLIGTATNFTVLIVLFVINGIAFTFFSGAEDAWAVDNLYFYQRADLIDEFYLKNQLMSYLAMFLSPLAAAAVIKAYSIQPLWYVWGGGYLLSALMLLFVEEKFRPKMVAIKQIFTQTIRNTRESLKLLGSNRNLFYTFLASTLMGFLFLDNEYWQPLLVYLEMPVHAIGYVISLSGLVGVLITLTLKFLRRYDFRYTLAVGVLVKMGLLIGAFFLAPPYFLLGAVFYIVAQSPHSLETPLLIPYIQSLTPSSLRATVLSVKSMAIKLTLGIGGMALGKLADVIGIQPVMVLVALFGFSVLWALTRIHPSPKVATIEAALTAPLKPEGASVARLK